MTNHIVLFEPQIPANTGNIARTCAATNTPLHLIEPLGFSTDDKQLKRAGLDYWHDVEIYYYQNIEEFLKKVQQSSVHLITKLAEKTYDAINYADEEDHYFIFGKETTGLPEGLMQKYEHQCLRVPMNDDHVRSLNLSNVAALVVYEALRQQEFQGLEKVHYYEEDKAKCVQKRDSNQSLRED